MALDNNDISDNLRKFKEFYQKPEQQEKSQLQQQQQEKQKEQQQQQLEQQNEQQQLEQQNEQQQQQQEHEQQQQHHFKVFLNVDSSLGKNELHNFGKRARDQSVCFVVLAELKKSPKEKIENILSVSEKIKDGFLVLLSSDEMQATNFTAKTVLMKKSK